MEDDGKSTIFPMSPSRIKREKVTPPRDDEKKTPGNDISTFLDTLFGIDTNVEQDDKKSVEPLKSSDEILTELFQVFNAAPPKKVLTKGEKKKKKHKKHKKKAKRRKREDNVDTDSESSDSEVSLANGRSKSKKKSEGGEDEKKKVKKLRRKSQEKAGKAMRIDVPDACERTGVKDKKALDKRDHLTKEPSRKIDEKEPAKEKEGEAKSHKIVIKDLKNSSILSVASKVEKGAFKDRRSLDRSSRKRPSDALDETRTNDKGASLSDFSMSDEDEYIHKALSPLRSRGGDHDSMDRRRRERMSHRSRHEDDFRRGYRNEKSDRGNRDRFWGGRNRERSRSRSRSRSRAEKSREKIDKKKLLEIARKNAISMLKNGTLPGCQNLAPADKEKALAKMTHGGKSIEELTEYCKKLSNGESLNDLSSVSSGNEDSDHDKDGNAKAFHHPFVVKDRGPIVMNIKNSVPIPPKTAEQTKALLMQFPVSSGQHHRATESEWVPVSPKKPDPPKESKKTAPIPAKQLSQAFYTIPTEELPPPTPARPPEPETVFPETAETTSLDVSSIISQRLNAMRKLQENPQDKDAQELMQNTQKDMSNWATSKFTPGKFLGSTGASILTAKELQSGYQAWAKRKFEISIAVFL
ncbi:protein Son isoform X2 [Phlebotomus argentipes]|uniref:protein Son isoform X2 n=1 Tax=Phlebotomus argentipes TaxID=94469 RepID=UPI002892F6B6|nr:protein Son isoform X2 [Phlebotomus argentipes]